MLLMVGVYVFRSPIKGYINNIRADRIFAKAQEAFEAENWVDASRLGTAAHHLRNGDMEIDLLVARALLKQRNAATVAWWNLVLDRPELPVEELRQLTASLLATRRVEEVLPFLSRLVELDGDNPETHRLWLQSLQLQHRYGKVRSLASEFAQTGSEDWDIHRAYLRMQLGGTGKADLQPVIDHLLKLIEADGPLALNAARELLSIEDLSMEPLNRAASYLSEHAQDILDELYAKSAQVKAGETPRKDLDPILNRVLEQPEQGHLQQLLNWSRWMGAGQWYLENIDWETYQANGGAPEGYLGLLASEQRYEQLLELAAESASIGGESIGTFLYYRSVALQETGQPEDAKATLNLAVETVNPADYAVLERYLARDGHWDLLSQLYDSILANDPDNKTYRVKQLGTLYYTGRQDDMGPTLEALSIGDFENQPDIQGFILYARLLENGFDADTHKQLESLMARYPEIFDFRLILAVSYILQNRAALATGLIADMPDLGLNAPRYLRVSAAIIKGSTDDLLLLGEMGSLLPREQFLLSLKREQPNP